jgi:hypothetical protein
MFICDVMSSFFDALNQIGASLGPSLQTVFDLVAGVLFGPLFYVVALFCDL